MGDSLTTEATGKPVVDADGNRTGIIVAVDNGVVYVEPDPTLSDTLKAKLGRAQPGRRSYPLDSRRVDAVTADAVHLGRAQEIGDE